ncbi:MAG TPA: hypothetical protein VMM12_12050 [Longimicrobiales bacterium]|nr:hypothetical protein [Longimicrobiales bacterium]
MYDLQPLNFYLGEDSIGNTAIYLRQSGTLYNGASDRYVAESGTVTVTRASHERVDGHFDMVVVYWCTPVVNGESCVSLPDEFPPDAQRIHLVGEFSAIPPAPVPTLPGSAGG